MKRLIAIAALAGVTACATPPDTYEFDNSAVLDASFDDTWNAAVDYFASRNIQIRTIEKASGVIYAEQMYSRPNDPDFASFADCGGAPLATPQGSAVRLNMTLREAGPDRTRVAITTSYAQQVLNLGAYIPTQMSCNSTGVLEDRVIQGVRNHLETASARS